MIDIKLFKEKTIFEKLKISLFNLPLEKTFYSGTAVFLSIIILIISSFYYFSKKTVIVPSKNQEMSMAVIGNFKYFNPIYTQSSADTFVSGLLYSGLLKKNTDSSWSKDLAESININGSGDKIDIQIKDTAKFSNGDSILTDDIIFTYELASNILADGVNRVKYEGLTFDKIDDRNFSVTLSKDFSNISEILSLGILSKTDYENESFETLQSSAKGFYSITSGIYKIDNFVKNNNNSSVINLSVNNNKYSNPNIKYIQLESYNDEDKLIQDINDGKNIDFIYNLNKELDIKNENFSEYKKSEYITPIITAIFLNPNKKDILAKKSLRKNIYYSIDRSSISSPNQARPSFDVLPGSNLKADLIGNLDEGISTSSSTVNLTIVDNEKQNKIAENIKISLQKIGLDVNIIREDQSNIINNIIKNRDFEMLLYSIEINNLEDLYAFWHSSQRNAPGLNITNYTSTNLDKNLNMIKGSTSTAEAQTSLDAILKEFYDEYPYMPIYTSVEKIYHKQDLEIKIPNQISSKKELSNNITNWDKDKEKIWPIIQRYDSQISKIYKLIH